MTCTLSITGLIIAISGYEVNLRHGGWKSWAMLSDIHHNDKQIIDAAIKVRIDSPFQP